MREARSCRGGKGAEVWEGACEQTAACSAVIVNVEVRAAVMQTFRLLGHAVYPTERASHCAHHTRPAEGKVCILCWPHLVFDRLLLLKPTGLAATSVTPASPSSPLPHPNIKNVFVVFQKYKHSIASAQTNTSSSASKESRAFWISSRVGFRGDDVVSFRTVMTLLGVRFFSLAEPFLRLGVLRR